MDVLTAIKNRRSVRSYAAKPIPTDLLDRMKAALHSAPSACNLQPWHFIIVTDAEIRGRLAVISHDQSWMADAGAIVAAIGYPEEAYKLMGGHYNSVEIDVAIALDHMSLAAVAEGLGTCWIGAFDESRVKSLLRIPEDVRVIAMMTLGYPSDDRLNAPITDDQRKSHREVFSENTYQKPA